MGRDEGRERLSEGFFEQLLLRAHDRGASHVHIEPAPELDGEVLRVRHRIDGELRLGETLPLELHEPLLAQIKRASRMSPDEQRLPQTGVLLLSTSSNQLHCDVEVIPGVRGEKASVWIQERSRRFELPLSELGMEREQLEHLRAALKQRSGLIALAGPTLSGRNTTAYSCLFELGLEGRGMASIEWVVRGRLPEVHQLVMDEDVGLNMSAALRVLSRADHEVIYARELMDFESLELSLRAVLFRGRLLLTTLHTQDAASVAIRMENMGMERWIIARSLLLVQAQRRLRRLCLECRRAVKVEARVLASAGLPPEHPRPEAFYLPVGCEHCYGTGYAGRLLVCETMPFTPTLQETFLSGVSGQELKEAAVREGMKTLRTMGLQRACEGLTSLDEVLMFTPADAS